MNLFLIVKLDADGKHPSIEASTDQEDGFECIELHGLSVDRARGIVTVESITVKFQGKLELVEPPGEEAVD